MEFNMRSFISVHKPRQMEAQTPANAAHSIAPQNLFLPQLGAPMSPGEVRRIERWLATARLTLAISALFAIWMDPSQISWWAHWLLGIYIIHGTVVMLLLRFREHPTPAFRFLVHAADLVWPALISVFAIGARHPFFLFFVFVLAAAAYRWGLWETVGTAAASVMLLWLESVAAHQGFLASVEDFLLRHHWPELGIDVVELEPKHLFMHSVYLLEFGDSASTCGSPCPAGTPYSALFNTGVIPQVDFNPISVNLLKFVPPPNTREGTFAFPLKGTLKQNQFLGRVDYQITPNDPLYFYGFWSRVPVRISLPSFGATLPGFGEKDIATTQQYLLSYHHIFSSNAMNDSRISYQRLAFQVAEPQNAILPSSAGFTGINPQFPAGAGLPFIDVLGFFDLGFSTFGPRSRVDDTGELTDSFTYVHASHYYKWGEMFVAHASSIRLLALTTEPTSLRAAEFFPPVCRVPILSLGSQISTCKAQAASSTLARGKFIHTSRINGR
jgi:hypothetical protein